MVMIKKSASLILFMTGYLFSPGRLPLDLFNVQSRPHGIRCHLQSILRSGRILCLLDIELDNDVWFGIRDGVYGGSEV